mmetsp:Transcript_24684/g.64324  ORF Transcript_24684/g.64324 Transcript_24684/m.64324 type:complete len:301 (+) Transcript_24684:680-1582(+)
MAGCAKCGPRRTTRRRLLPSCALSPTATPLSFWCKAEPVPRCSTSGCRSSVARHRPRLLISPPSAADPAQHVPTERQRRWKWSFSTLQGSWTLWGKTWLTFWGTLCSSAWPDLTPHRQDSSIRRCRCGSSKYGLATDSTPSATGTRRPASAMTTSTWAARRRRRSSQGAGSALITQRISEAGSHWGPKGSVPRGRSPTGPHVHGGGCTAQRQFRSSAPRLPHFSQLAPLRRNFRLPRVLPSWPRSSRQTTCRRAAVQHSPYRKDQIQNLQLLLIRRLCLHTFERSRLTTGTWTRTTVPGP